jgi:ferritin-like metal-binding protein YciE
LLNSAEAIRKYLQDAIAAEAAFEERLSRFANEGDDQDVQFAFAQHADETRRQRDRLADRLAALGSEPSKGEGAFAWLLDLPASLPQMGRNPEGRLLQNLITTFCIETGECALYEALATIARSAGDEITERLAREIQAEDQRAAETIFHFLPTRSKIAFNVLTADEVDPAVETKVGIT